MARKKKSVLEQGHLCKEGISEEKEDCTKEEKNIDDKDEAIHEGEMDSDTSTEAGREELMENDEISPDEEAFSEGAEETGEKGNCAYCGKPLSQDKKNVIEKEIDGETVWFCCNACARKGKKPEAD